MCNFTSSPVGTLFYHHDVTIYLDALSSPCCHRSASAPSLATALRTAFNTSVTHDGLCSGVSPTPGSIVLDRWRSTGCLPAVLWHLCGAFPRDFLAAHVERESGLDLSAGALGASSRIVASYAGLGAANRAPMVQHAVDTHLHRLVVRSACWLAAHSNA